ncbi:hypothetical protein BX600DRAFT_470161 [Xylariales sp. PMI_506]|nr:hypothetical protein BX600DRAFT_470161 [Xylariales sp. PMI_506]
MPWLLLCFFEMCGVKNASLPPVTSYAGYCENTKGGVVAVSSQTIRCTDTTVPNAQEKRCGKRASIARRKEPCDEIWLTRIKGSTKDIR